MGSFIAGIFGILDIFNILGILGHTPPYGPNDAPAGLSHAGAMADPVPPHASGTCAAAFGSWGYAVAVRCGESASVWGEWEWWRGEWDACAVGYSRWWGTWTCIIE